MTFPLDRLPDRRLSVRVGELSKRQISGFSQSQLFHFKRHENLYCHEDSGLWKIHSGYVRSLIWNSEGDPVPLGFWTEGDIVGNAVFQKSGSAIAPTSYCQAQCLSEVSAEYIGHSENDLQSAILAQIRQSNDLLQIAHFRQSELRLFKFIGWLAAMFGETTPAGRRLPVKLTHQEIADSISSTRVTVTRLLKALEYEGKVSWTAKERIVYNTALEQL